MIASAPGSVKVSSFRFVPNDGVGDASWQSRTLPTIFLHRQKRQAAVRRLRGVRLPPSLFIVIQKTRHYKSAMSRFYVILLPLIRHFLQCPSLVFASFAASFAASASVFLLRLFRTYSVGVCPVFFLKKLKNAA